MVLINQYPGVYYTVEFPSKSYSFWYSLLSTLLSHHLLLLLRLLIYNTINHLMLSVFMIIYNLLARNFIQITVTSIFFHAFLSSKLYSKIFISPFIVVASHDWAVSTVYSGAATNEDDNDYDDQDYCWCRGLPGSIVNSGTGVMKLRFASSSVSNIVCNDTWLDTTVNIHLIRRTTSIINTLAFCISFALFNWTNWRILFQFIHAFESNIKFGWQIVIVIHI